MHQTAYVYVEVRVGKREWKIESVTDLDVTVSLEVKYGKAANIPQSVYMDGNLQKVDDCWRTRWQRISEDERRDIREYEASSAPEEPH